jgi:hypothetical protein
VNSLGTAMGLLSLFNTLIMDVGEMSRFAEVLTVSSLTGGRTWVTEREFGYRALTKTFLSINIPK